jgi:hypothetical protein
MTSRTRKPKTRKELSKAELKAYEARRADERKRIGVDANNPLQPVEPAKIHLENSFAMTRDEEFSVIKSDLSRLLIILAVITMILIVMAFILR